MTIIWTNETVTLGDLKPWGHNPRRSTKKQAAALLDSMAEFGQVQTIAIGPDGEVYDGHQRLSALLTVHGKAHRIDARRADRALTDEERRRLVLKLHIAANGEWDLEALGNWDLGLLVENGFDNDWLRGLNSLQAFGIELLGEGDSNEADGSFGKNPDEQMEVYESGEYGRQIVLLYSMDEYKIVIGRLEKYVEKNNIGNYSDALVALLDEAEK